MNGELVDWADANDSRRRARLALRLWRLRRNPRLRDRDAAAPSFASPTTSTRLQNSAKLLYMELPYSVDELKAACVELIGANGRAECYLRPIAFYGYGELGVSARRATRVDVAIMRWPWGTYLGEEGQRDGIRAKISSWKRVGAERDPARREGDRASTSTRCSRCCEANRAGYEEAILLTDEGYIADGSGENDLRRQGRRRCTRLISPRRSSPGITRDTVIQIAQDLGYSVVEKPLIRTDLYLADEVFMCGTAAEVTPIREVDDHVDRAARAGDARDPAGTTSTPCDGRSERWAQWLEYAPRGRSRGVKQASRASRLPQAAIPLARPYLGRARGRARARGHALGTALARPDDRRTSKSSSPRASARRTRPRSRAAPPGLHLLCVVAGIEPGDEVITSPFSFVASANCFVSRGRHHPSSRTSSRATFNMNPARSRLRSRIADEGDRGGRHLSATRASSTSCARSPHRHGLVFIEDACEASAPSTRARPLGSHGESAVFAFYPNKQITTGEGGIVTTHSKDVWRQLVSPAQPGPRYDDGRLARARPARLQLPIDGCARGDRNRAAGEARRDPRAARPPWRRATTSFSPVSPVWRLPCAGRRRPSSARGSSTSSRSPDNDTASA